MNKEHVTVLLNEAIDGLNIKKDGIYVDLTLGRGGHSSLILSKLNKSGHLYAFDKDIEAINKSREVLEKIGNNFTLIHSDFRNLTEELQKLGVNKVDGIIMDLGVSSPQFDDASRGFSYRNESRLDMRMDQEQELSAYEVVNSYSLNELTRVFREYGEDKYSYQIAKNIVKHRENKPIETTFDLVEIIKESKPQKELQKKGHPAKQIFQAIRIEVNDELGALKEAIEQGLTLLNASGRFVIISFHSLEDRIVKNEFLKVSKVEGNRHNVYSLPSEEDEAKFRLISHKVILPSEEEMEVNPRSKSAKMRILEKK